MKFAPREMDQDTFLTLAGSGYAFTYIFKGNRRKPEFFLNTSVILFDLDHCEKPMEDYIDGLRYKPSLAYTSYSNGRDGRFSYRLVYCLDTLVEDEATFNSIYTGIAAANGFGTEFDRRRLNQLYFGSNKDLAGYQQYVSHLVYSPGDFGILPEGVNSSREVSMEEVWEPTPTQHHTNNYETDGTLNDEERLEYYDNYVRSLETPLLPSASGTHYYYPEEYYAVPFRIITWDGKKVVKRWRDGEHRRKRLYIAALIMLRNVPNLTPDNLRFNLWQLMREYFDNTSEDRITPGDIDGIVERAMANKDTFHLDPTRHERTFKLNKEYWQGEADSVLEAVKAVRKERNKAKMEHYDWTISVSANQREMEKMGYKLSTSTIYRYLNEMGIPRRDLDAEILELMLQDPTITIKDIATALGKSPSTIKRHVKQLFEQSRIRHRKKPWIVLNDIKA